MVGMIIKTGIGSLAFKLGMAAQRMKAECRSIPEIIARMPAEESFPENVTGGDLF